MRMSLALNQTSSTRPSLKGPGYECKPAFGQEWSSANVAAAVVFRNNEPDENYSIAAEIEFRNGLYEKDDREDLR